MSNTVISVENLSKSYRLGQIGTGTLTNDLKLWWAKKRGLPNPLLKIGQTDHGNRDGEELWALRDVSFTVQQGELLGIIGHNGAGKSTLLKIFSQVTAPTNGIVRIKGRTTSLLEIGTGFHPELTGRENIFINGAILGMTKKEIINTFDDIVSFSEVSKYIDTPVKRYSSGMYVRLAFAVSAYLRSQIMIIDEVLAVGDQSFQKKCIDLLQERRNNGQTILFVSHNLEIVNRICTRVIVLDHGEIVDDGQSLETTSNYKKEIALRKVKNEIQNKKRYGTEDIKITDVVMLNENQLAVEKILSGDKLVFRIYFFANSLITSPVFSISSVDNFGSTSFFELATSFDNFDTGNVFGSGYIDLVIDNLNLTPGVYPISIAVADSKALIQYDFLSNWMYLEVNGNKPGRGLVHFSHSWKINLSI